MSATCPLSHDVPSEYDLIEFENSVLKAFEIAAGDRTANDTDHRLIQTMNRLIQLARDVDDCDPEEDEDHKPTGSPSELLRVVFS